MALEALFPWERAEAKESLRRSAIVVAVEKVSPAVVNISTLVTEKVSPFFPFGGDEFFKDFFPEMFSREYKHTSLGSAAIERDYYPEVVELLMRTTGAAEVYVFDHTLRMEDEAKRRAHGTRLPVSVVHNDYTERSVPQRVRDVLAPGTAARLLAGRFTMVNVWRSIGASAERFPLAAADGRTVPPADYVAVDLVYPDRTGEVYYNTHSDGQRWFYFSRMQRGEAMLLKCFDSALDGRTRYRAHTGFANPHAPAHVPPRESIEVRTLLFFG